VWWAWLRCGLIGEFYGHPPVPPPFTLLYRALQAVLLLVAGVCGVCEALARCVSHCFACCCRKREGGFIMTKTRTNLKFINLINTPNNIAYVIHNCTLLIYTYSLL